jgi:hypothetical protein
VRAVVAPRARRAGAVAPLTAAADGNLGNGVSTKYSLMGDGPICIREIEQSGKDRGGVPGWKAMARAAVDRSAGHCEAFWGRADDEVPLYLADRLFLMDSCFHVFSLYSTGKGEFTNNESSSQMHTVNLEHLISLNNTVMKVQGLRVQLNSLLV